MTCGDPGLGANVTREGRNFDYGSIVTFTCVPQHVLLGGGLETLWIRCTAQGTWNGTAPSCERMYYPILAGQILSHVWSLIRSLGHILLLQ